MSPSSSEEPDTTTTTGSAWLDLHLRPFSRQAGLSRPFTHTGFLMQANVLRDRILEPGSVTVLRGEPGIGRHALLDHLTNELRNNVYWHRLQMRAHTDLGRALGRRFPGSADPEADWARLIAGDQVDPTHSVVLVDDAQLLSTGDLERLLQLLEEQAPQASLVLVAEPSIEPLIARLDPETAARIHTLSVLPLRRNQLAEYVAHRLRVAGIRSRSPLGDAELRRIYRESGGVPGRINEVARNILEEIYESEQEDVDFGRGGGNPATTALLLSGALLLITGGAWLWAHMDERETPRPRLAASDAGQVRGPSERTTETLSLPPPSSSEPADEPKPSPPTTTPGPDQTSPPSPSPESAATSPEPAIASATTPVTLESGEPDAAPSHRRAPEPTPDRDTTDLQGPDWLMDQASDAYTLQVLAVRDFTAIERLCASPGACAQAAWYAQERDGSTWYRLVVGAYRSRVEAREAIEELPPGLRDQTPWIRPLRDVQRAISEGSRPAQAGN
ncbi:MAG: SPOR domain-containing protein [Chromatiales bacterium]|jgi:DamX protein